MPLANEEGDPNGEYGGLGETIFVAATTTVCAPHSCSVECSEEYNGSTTAT